MGSEHAGLDESEDVVLAPMTLQARVVFGPLDEAKWQNINIVLPGVGSLVLQRQGEIITDWGIDWDAGQAWTTLIERPDPCVVMGATTPHGRGAVRAYAAGRNAEASNIQALQCENGRLREALCAIRDGGSVADHRIAVEALGADHDA